MDAAVRAQVEAGIRCHQKGMELFQAGTHQLNAHYEASLLELKLPPYIQETMLAVAHASTVRQDAEIAGQYAKPRQLDKAGMDLLKFTDEHADHITLQDHQRIFSD